MKNQLRAIAVLLLGFGLITLLSYSTLIQKVFVGLMVVGLIYGLYSLVLGIINEIYEEDKD